jgi:hypothetical protein
MKKSDYLPVGTQVHRLGEPGWEIMQLDYFTQKPYWVVNHETRQKLWAREDEITRAPVTLDTLIEGDVLISEDERAIIIQGRIGAVYVAIDSEDEGIFYTIRELEEYGYEIVSPEPDKITLTRAEAAEKLKDAFGKDVEITD